MKIIVTGSLGNISRPLVQILIANEHTVTVISSKKEREKDIETLGAIPAIGSLEDANFLVNAFIDADAIYTMIPPNFAAADQLLYYQSIAHSYAEAIRISGVKRIVNLSSWGADLAEGTGVILGSYHTEKILNALPGVAITHLRPTFFYYNLYHFAEMIKGAGFIGTNYGGNDLITMVSPIDIAETASEELNSQTLGVRVRYVASDERTCNEIAQVLGTAIGKPDLKWITFSDEQVQTTMEQNGIPPHLAAKLVELNVSIHSGALRQDYDLHKPDIMGKVKLEDFAREFAAAFNHK